VEPFDRRERAARACAPVEEEQAVEEKGERTQALKGGRLSRVAAIGVLVDDLRLLSAPVAKTGMLIRRPVADVFDAFVEPAITFPPGIDHD
jgi:hypothetical protein